MMHRHRAETRSFFVVGVAAAFSVATVDLTSDAPLAAARFHSGSYFVETFGISLAVFLVSYFLAASLAAAASLFVRPPPLVAPMFVAGGLFWLRGFLHSDDWRSGAVGLGVVILPAMGAGLGWLLGRLQQRSEEWRRFLARAPIAVVVGSIAVLLFHWLSQYGGREIAKTSPLAAASAWILAVAALLFLLYRDIDLRGARGAAVVLTALALGSLSRPLFSSTFRASDETVLGGSEPAVRAVIVIVVDTLRADALRPYNPEAAEAGGFDEFAADSFLFENAISPAPWTYSSMLSVMTGLRSFDRPSLSQMSYLGSNSAPTLARYLADATYRTRGILGNHLLYRPLQAIDGLANVETYSLAGTGFSVGAKFGRRINPKRYLSGGGTKNLTDQAVDFLRQVGSEPFFLWLHYFDPHDEYAPPHSYLPPGTTDAVFQFGESKDATAAQLANAKKLYEGEVRYVGDSLSRLLNEIKRLGLYKDSLIVLTSDHGEEFGDHGGIFHGHTLYQELLRVPLMIRTPGQREAQRIQSFIPTRALLPTILEICEVDVQENPDWAPSLVQLMESVSNGAGEEGGYGHPIVSGAALEGNHETSVVLHGLKYIVQSGASDQDLLFDLQADPSELHPIEHGDPQAIAAMKQAAESHQQWAAEMRKQTGLAADSVEANTFTHRLRNLGYIQ